VIPLSPQEAGRNRDQSVRQQRRRIKVFRQALARGLLDHQNTFRGEAHHLGRHAAERQDEVELLEQRSIAT